MPEMKSYQGIEGPRAQEVRLEGRPSRAPVLQALILYRTYPKCRPKLGGIFLPGGRLFCYLRRLPLKRRGAMACAPRRAEGAPPAGLLSSASADFTPDVSKCRPVLGGIFLRVCAVMSDLLIGFNIRNSGKRPKVSGLGIMIVRRYQFVNVRNTTCCSYY